MDITSSSQSSRNGLSEDGELKRDQDVSEIRRRPLKGKEKLCRVKFDELQTLPLKKKLSPSSTSKICNETKELISREEIIRK